MTDQTGPGENDAGKGEGATGVVSLREFERMTSHEQLAYMRKDPAGFARFLNHHQDERNR